MEIRNLLTFLKVAEVRSFSKAADKLGYSQSNVSLQIQQLENELEIKLFERTGKNIRLTKQGQDFLFHASEIIRMVQQAKDSIKFNEKEELTGTISVGSVECIATSLLPDILVLFHQKYPHIQTNVVIDSKDHLVEKLRNNEIDLFFHLGNKEVIQNLTQTVLKKEDIIFVTYHDQYENQEKVSLSKIIEEPFILTEKGESYRYELDKILYQNNLSIQPVIEISNPEIIVHLVEKKIGCSFLPRFCVRNALKKKHVYCIDADMKPIYMYSQLFYHKNKWLSPQFKAFIDFVNDYYATAL